MAGTSHRRRLGSCRRRRVGVAAMVAAGMISVGAKPVAAGTAHPCLPGETDVVGTFTKYLDGGSTQIDVWMCVDGGPEVPTPNVPWGSLTNGVPCGGPGRAIGKVRVDFGDTGPLLVWMCADEPPSPPPPGSRPATRTTSAQRPTLSPIGAPTRFEPITPQRVLDTRRPDQSILVKDEVRRVALGSVLGAAMTGAAVNITAADASEAGYLTVWDCSGARPGTSTVNFRAGVAAAASAVALVDAAREFCVYTSASTHILIDVNGGYSPTGGYGFTSIAPRRVYDSRPTPVPAASTTRITISGLTRAARAAVLNLTAVAPDAAGYLTVWPCSVAQPEVSNLNFPAGISAIANAAQVPVDPDGSVCVYNSATTGVLVDILGVYDDSPTGRRYQPAIPLRLLDTRVGTGGWLGAIGNSQVLDVSAPLSSGLVGTVTLVDPPQEGYLTVDTFLGGSARAFSTINMTDSTIANMFVASASGSLIAAAGPTGGEHVLIDLTGYFVAP